MSDSSTQPPTDATPGDSYRELARPIMKANPGRAQAKIVLAIEAHGAKQPAATEPEKEDRPERPSRRGPKEDTDFFDNK